MDRNYYVITFISKYHCFKKAWGNHFCSHHQIITMFIKKSLKTQENLKELEIMYQNAIYICFSWYNNNLLISGEKMLMSSELRGGVTWFISFWIIFR